MFKPEIFSIVDGAVETKFLRELHFNFSVPFKKLLGFAEDYKKVLLKCKHELVLMLTKILGDVFEQTRNEQTFNLENSPCNSERFLQKLRWTILLKESECSDYIQDCNLVTIIVSHNNSWKPLLLWLVFHIKTIQWKMVLLMWEFQ